MFEVKTNGQVGTVADVFPNSGFRDRFGIVLDGPLGGVGATHLLQLAIVCFYEVKPERRGAKAIYPEIYAFHFGRGFGTHAPFDFWPSRREVVRGTEDHRVNDRAITRLAIPDRRRREIVHGPKETEAALGTIRSALVCGPTVRVAQPDIAIRGISQKTEFNPKRVIHPLGAAEIEDRAIVRSADVSAQDPGTHRIRARGDLSQRPRGGDKSPETCRKGPGLPLSARRTRDLLAARIHPYGHRNHNKWCAATSTVHPRH